MNFKMNMPKEVEIAHNILKNNGFESYVVGGCVRDSILCIEPKDWDIATSALPSDILKYFKNYKTIETGIEHGTVAVIINDMQLEITTYRIDGEYIDNRRPNNVEFTSDITYDLQRRDFTINSLAYNYENGVIDLYGGIEDIKLKQIKCVGNSNKRFREDGLRILRALRFSSVLGFQIERDTSNSIHKNKDLLKNISKERLSIEFNKLITGVGFFDVLNEYRDVIAVFIPEIDGLFNLRIKNTLNDLDLWEGTLKGMSNVSNDLNLRLAMLFHDIGKSERITMDEKNMVNNIDYSERSSNIVSDILQNLKYDKTTIEIVRNLVLYSEIEIKPTSIDIKIWLNKMGNEIFDKLLVVKKAYIKSHDHIFTEKLINDIKQIESIKKEILIKGQCYDLKKLAVTGKDLIQIGLPEGKYMGEILNELLYMVIYEKIKNNKNELLKYVKNSMKKYLDKGKLEC